ncbi:hypothetical protein THAOC_13224 [Thalassiosira oceanica]|uniref:Mitochondrial import inner membrane translocase subunit TIM50 n=1 Tax=Thalassiosira oceanica TaxID=159749 RepID=K0SI54_THAOC|nr:hypothetical protein THAOC_13224 [Thalassiosira oceanica]|eukprot:EJK65878.1 hypothetical protein THAOC_13224 [Thalassiosira oceanica]
MSRCRYLQCAADVSPHGCVSVCGGRDSSQQAQQGGSDPCPETNTGEAASPLSRVERRKAKKSRKRGVQRAATRLTTTAPFGDLLLANPCNIKGTIVFVKPLIVLDLNGILCHRSRSKLCSDSSIYRPSVGRVANTEVIPRSDIDTFLHFLDSRFTLAVWTSAQRKTAKHLVRLLFPPSIERRLIFIWNRNLCKLMTPEANVSRKRKQRSISNKQEDNLARAVAQFEDRSVQDFIAIKSLEKVWKAFPLWDASNTILFDDSPDKTPVGLRGNSVHPPSLKGTMSGKSPLFDVDDDADNQRKQMEFFERLADHFESPSNSAREALHEFLQNYFRKEESEVG